MILVLGILLLVAGMIFIMPMVLKRVNPKLHKPLKSTVFSIYLLGNLYITLLSREAGRVARYELTFLNAYKKSFQLDSGILGTIRRLLTEGFPAGIQLVTTEPLEGVILNILLYIPMGWLLPLIWPKLGTIRVILIGFLSSLLTETIQLLFHLGWFDVDDLINNTLGTAAGVVLYLLLMRKKQR